LESLDTNIWSLIIFMVNALSLLSVILLFSKTFIRTIILTILLWVSVQVIYILYGYYTNQLGFILMGIFNIIVGIVAMFTQVGQDGEDDED
jgi:hypothetical protein